MKNYVILRIIAKIMMPLILLFALYVQLHGEYSPGGGFQAGIVFATSLVLYTLIFGLDAAHAVISPAAVARLVAAGPLIYLAVGVWSLLAGGEFLEYKVLSEVAQTGEVIGIVVIELGVGITVAGVSLTLFYCVAGYRRGSGGEQS